MSATTKGTRSSAARMGRPAAATRVGTAPRDRTRPDTAERPTRDLVVRRAVR